MSNGGLRANQIVVDSPLAIQSSLVDLSERPLAFWRSRRMFFEHHVDVVYRYHRQNPRDTASLLSLFLDLPDTWSPRPEESGVTWRSLMEWESNLYVTRCSDLHHTCAGIEEACEKALNFIDCVRRSWQ
jgi:hypothetical protein